jgi:hypothetical protein
LKFAGIALAIFLPLPPSCISTGWRQIVATTQRFSTGSPKDHFLLSGNYPLFLPRAHPVIDYCGQLGILCNALNWLRLFILRTCKTKVSFVFSFILLLVGWVFGVKPIIVMFLQSLDRTREASPYGYPSDSTF